MVDRQWEKTSFVTRTNLQWNKPQRNENDKIIALLRLPFVLIACLVVGILGSLHNLFRRTSKLKVGPNRVLVYEMNRNEYIRSSVQN